MTDEQPAETTVRTQTVVLLGSVFIIANCGLIYELLAGTISAYLVGAAVIQFSLVVGVFMAAMGVGAFLSQLVRRDLLDVFVRVEVAVGFFGGFSAFILYLAFAYMAYYTVVLYALCALVGVFIGMEIPLVIRLLKDELSLEVNVSAVLSLDYVGALIASLLFPLALLPYLGQLSTGFFTGLLNVAVALLCSWLLRDHLARPVSTIATAAVAAALLFGGLAVSGKFVTWFESSLYEDRVIYSTTSKYQRIVLTKWREDVRLYLDGNLQFSTIDEYRYHETLVHTVMGMPGKRSRVLVLGGGDGMALREILKYEDVEQIDLVDLDGKLTDLFSTHPALRQLNDDALNSPRVTVHNLDGQKFLEKRGDALPYDRVIIDFPDPNNTDVGKLYTVGFYRLLAHNLAGSGYAITQATSPYLARKSFWCIENTIDNTETRAADGTTFHTAPLHTYVPTFGEWGFVLMSQRPIHLDEWSLDVGTRYLSEENFASAFVFPGDMARVPTRVNHLDSQVLLRYYERDWSKYFE
jgi:spermidine synthase